MTTSALRVVAVLAGLAGPLTSAAAQAPAAAATPAAGPSYAFVNGRWFTGTQFQPGARYSVNGMFVARRPARVDSVVDLGGNFVIPPFGDAHTHNLDGSYGLEAIRNAYLREGTFYVQVLTNTQTGAAEVRSQFNRPCTLDVAYANGGITGTLSHPYEIYEGAALGYFGWPQWHAHASEVRASRRREGNAYWFVDSAADMEAKWPRILAGHPDLIKIYLLDASDTASVPADTGLAAGHGLKPSLVPEIVRHAHAAGLRVAAHIETAADFAVAVRAGVDIIAHLPGYDMQPNTASPAGRWELDEATARLAAARGVVVTPTAAVAASAFGPDSAEVLRLRRPAFLRNLRLLLEQGVRIAVGSDSYGQTAARDFTALRDLGVWDNAGLLRLWAVATPQAIYPRRLIGRLQPGYEASFLVLAGNPLQNLDAVRTISMRVKQGCVIQMSP